MAEDRYSKEYKLNFMGKAVIIVIMGSVMLMNFILVNMSKRINEASDVIYRNYYNEQARNISNSVMQIVYTQFYDSTEWRQTTPANISLFGASASYTLKDTLFEGDSLVKITVNSQFKGSGNTLTALVPLRFGGGWIPPVMRAAWTANGDLNRTISDMNVDGRNHTSTGSLVPLTGLLGVSTGGNFVNTYKAMIGGTKNSVDYPLSYPQNPNTIEANYLWGSSYPASPDQILGYPEGTLITIAKSGVKGSQYVTDISKLHYPLSGITYIYIADGKSVTLSLDKSGTPSGMVIWHNEKRTAKITGITSKVPFKGILIGDYGFHFHLDVYGGIILLSPNLEMSGTCNGNNSHSVLYSAEVVTECTGLAGKFSGCPGNNPNWLGSNSIIGSQARNRLRLLHVIEN